MSGQIPANGRSEEFSHQFPVCTQFLRLFLRLYIRSIASRRKKKLYFLYRSVHHFFLLSSPAAVCNSVGRIRGGVYNKNNKLVENYTKMLLAATHQLYGHLLPIFRTAQVKQARHAGYCWKKQERTKK